MLTFIIQAAGFNAVSIYLHWGASEGKVNFSPIE